MLTSADNAYLTSCGKGTPMGELLRRFWHPALLSAELPEPALVLPCDVTDDAQVAAVIAAVDAEFGGLDFVVHGAAFAPREELMAPFVETTRDGFRTSIFGSRAAR